MYIYIYIYIHVAIRQDRTVTHSVVYALCLAGTSNYCLSSYMNRAKTNNEYSRTSIIRTPVCHFNVKSVQINEFVRMSEISDKITPFS